MKSSLQVLQEPACLATDVTHKSLWPDISSRLPKPATEHRRANFNGWFAGASVAVACSVLITFAITYQSPQRLKPLKFEAVHAGFLSAPEGNWSEETERIEGRDLFAIPELENGALPVRWRPRHTENEQAE